MKFQVRVTGFRNGRGQFASLANSLPGGLREAHQRIAPDIQQKFEQRSPVASGQLSTSWVYTIDDDSLEFTNDVGYLDAVLKGRRPGWIDVKDGGTLHFFWAGKEFFRKSVYHPGTEPNDFTQGIDDDYIRIMLPQMAATIQILIDRHLTDG